MTHSETECIRQCRIILRLQSPSFGCILVKLVVFFGGKEIFKQIQSSV